MYHMVHKWPEEAGAIRGFRDKAMAGITSGLAARAHTAAGRER